MKKLGLLFLSHSILVVRPWNFFVSVFPEYECVTCYIVIMDPMDSTENESVILIEMVLLRRIFILSI